LAEASASRKVGECTQRLGELTVSDRRTFGHHQNRTQRSVLAPHADIGIGGDVGSGFMLLRRKMFAELRMLQGKSYGRMRWMPIVIGTEF
jgi:hypothetical protein